MSGVEALEVLAQQLDLPESVNLQDTNFLRYFTRNAGSKLLDFDAQGRRSFDPVGVRLYEADLQDIYERTYFKKAGRNPQRRINFRDPEFMMKRYAEGHDIPVVSVAESGSPITSVGFWHALHFDLRLAAKYADDDARVLNAPRDRGLFARFFLAGAFIVGTFVGSYLGVSLAFRNGLERARGELDDYVFPRFQQELRSGIDANVQRYLGSFIAGNSLPDSASPKPRKLPED